MRDLKDIREDINKVDDELQELFLRRMELANQVAEYKLATNGAVYDKVREEQMVADHLNTIPEHLAADYESFLRNIIRLSRKNQYGIICDKKNECDTRPKARIIGFQGVEGSYSQVAAKEMYPDCDYRAFASFDEVVNELKKGEIDVGVLPIENSTAGSVTQVLDLVMKEAYISKEYVEKIEHCLAAQNGSNFDKVVSHPQALAQCESYLKKHDLKAQVASNTAVAAKIAAGDSSIAAICSKEAAQINGLEIIEENINDFAVNSTRFVGLRSRLTVESEDDRVSIAFRLPDVTGALAGVMSALQDYKINATEITSRPAKSEAWEYLFFLTMEGNLESDAMNALLYQLKMELPSLKVIGSFKGVSK